ncbi:hypothetical protein J1N35_000113 [Gossypium stocksii]|uniref:Zinc finger PMZ-type domain-containing protein n=1 Tax=Gossypium stocksii TaxID=47602 RepID=A0A9D3WH26_9ROSI|nr:hypothetical protein J1N35_000113 [Gossypium stocksii]
MAMGQLYGDYDSSYNELQRWIAAMREYVPGTTFNPCVRVFPYCKPFVQVEETWLYGKYTQILLAVAQDGNRNVLPIAFAIVDEENLESWEFFLTNLRRGKGIIATIRRFSVPWRFVYCIRYISKDHKLSGGGQQRRLETFRVTETIGRRPDIPPKSYGVDLWNKRCKYRRFETLHYPCEHVVAACTKVNLNVDQFVDDVYTLECTLRV